MDHALAVEGTGEVYAVLVQAQVDLARAAELAKPREHQPDDLLGAQVGIHPKAEFTVPDVADGHADAQLARLLPSTRKLLVV